MTPEQIEKAKWLSELYAAVANGEELECWHNDTEEWSTAHCGPSLTSRTDWWRIKPKPRRFWIRLNKGVPVESTDLEETAVFWRSTKSTSESVIETVEVLL
jgi:hypothetical protein